MTPAELPAYLRRLARDVKDRAALDAADAMAQTYQVAVVKSMKGYGDDPSPPGTPPARKTGTLARSVRPEPAKLTGSGRATSSVAPHTVYARIQQLGGVIRIKRAPWLVWHDKWGWHKAKSVKLPPRPYMVMNDDRRRDCRSAAVKAVERVVSEALGG
jgi:phage gpG-like protein